jgi:hypothetical protein
MQWVLNPKGTATATRRSDATANSDQIFAELIMAPSCRLPAS